MNIWLINHYALPPTEAGGTRHYSHARELIRRGHNVHIIACNFNHMKHCHLPIAKGRVWERQLLAGVPFTWITARGYRGNSLSRILNMMEFAQRTCKADWIVDLPNPDLIVGSTPDPFAALAGQRLAARYGVPFVMEVRDPWPHAFMEMGDYSRYHPLVVTVDKLMRYLYSKAERIILTSDSADIMVRYGADRAKTVWIPQGVDLNMNPTPQPLVDDGLFTVTYMGAHSLWASLDPILDAAKILQERGVSRLLIRFVGDGVAKPGLVERAKREGIRNVRFDDPVPKQQLPEVLHQSDAFIINNRKGAPNGFMSFQKIFDYLAGGRPVIYGCCNDINPVNDSGAGICVEPDNAGELAGAIERLSHLSLAQLWQYGQRGRLFIEQKYSIPTLVERLENIAYELTGQPKPDAQAVCN